MSKTDKKSPAAFIFGKRPDSIQCVVKFPLPDGTEAEVKTQFAYRTRKEFGALWDDVSASGREMIKPLEGDAFTYENMMGRGNAMNAKNAMKYISGWEGVPVELNEANLEQLFDEAPAAVNAFWNAYRAAIAEGRLGN